MQEKDKQKITTPIQAKSKLENYCAYQERSQLEVRKKLRELGIESDVAENIIVDLIENNFINEERFALAYAGGKFRINKWGKIKIKQGLKQHNISEYCIKKALQSIEEKDYFETLEKLIEKKFKETKESNIQKKTNIIISSIVNKGYEWEFTNDIVREKLKNTEF